MKLHWHGDSWVVRQQFRGIVVRARPFQLLLGTASRGTGERRCGRGKYPVTPVAFEKTRLSAGRVLGCQPLSDRTLSPWQHKDNVVISLLSRLCLVCLLAKGNLSGRPHTYTHTHVGLHTASPSGKTFLVLQKQWCTWFDLRNYCPFSSLYALSTERRGRTQWIWNELIFIYTEISDWLVVTSNLQGRPFAMDTNTHTNVNALRQN